MTSGGRSAPIEGEQWAAAQLTALRSSGYDAAAWGGFLEASYRRAAETRRQRRALSHQAVRWTLGGALATAALRWTTVHRGARAPSPRVLASWWLTQALMMDWHLGMVQGLDGASRERLSVADALTLSRAAVAPFAACAPPDAVLFLALLGFAGATDLLDGRFARRHGPTRFGRDFDPLADLAFRAAAVHGARRAGWLSPGPAWALAARQALLVFGAAWSWFGHSQRPPMDPARLARWDAPPLIAGLALAALDHR
ncbi:MAG: CDP-alcohol phosphatidyltransferase family protein, partial [Actinomycetota bacterium]|nr:CDP-alcohol phosphatidyltransferase family protein [Actinomycetota bacterium]